MICLIAGAPRCGKTTTAKQLSQKLAIPWIAADTIESMVASVIRKEDRDALFPKEIIRRKTDQSNDKMYTKYSTDEIVDAYIAQAHASWPAIKMMIECELRDDHDYIIEGHQIHPELMHWLATTHGAENITSLVLTRMDVDGIVSGCLKHSAPYDWFIQKTSDESTYPKIAKMIQAYSEFFAAEAEKYDIKVVNVDGDFHAQIEHAVSQMIE